MSRPTALVGAMQQELAALLARCETERVVRLAGRDFHVGRLHGHHVVLVLCGIGKVAAATTATLLGAHFRARRLVFTGVAGGLGEGVRVGDVVLADCLLQHDLDASPLFPRHEVPLTGRSRFDADTALNLSLARAVRRVIDRPGHFGPDAAALGVTQPQLHRGLVISGDRFIGDAQASLALQRELPDALAVEMEGAALAQVAHDLSLPFAVLRTISDRADDSAHVDFLRFIDVVAAQVSADVVGRWLADDAPLPSA
ncbi:5'-methylthioadenosine/adenosylhomocysteine nucleosidase [Leptothrix discophora]|uniref:5'-methylthioadenosine/adenosylhomocysteine nucleosidase n=1 Tax=Leptothrix discophora TaxID=89 RepID=A0ABT9G770_LEPDI|nr:5'-methylthioadenosine/adenosylhomocysteine nucleosidase [Leptothrix discophora]MDP4302280.1 5'-methylthioadenosine/adenosylhomocysteine nucleosidase [Leptothrix discophora]